MFVCLLNTGVLKNECCPDPGAPGIVVTTSLPWVWCDLGLECLAAPSAARETGQHWPTGALPSGRLRSTATLERNRKLVTDGFRLIIRNGNLTEISTPRWATKRHTRRPVLVASWSELPDDATGKAVQNLMAMNGELLNERII